MSITIEEGKSYIDGDGKVLGPAAPSPKSRDYPWALSGFTFTNDGQFSIKGTYSGRDLVREHVEVCELGKHYRGPGDVCTICGATPEQVNAQARTVMQPVNHREPGEFGEGATIVAGAEALTNERKNTHGDWRQQARVGVKLDVAVQDSPGYDSLPTHQRKAIDMILVKVSRIVSGDPGHDDHWDDIAGYAYLGKDGHKPA